MNPILQDKLLDLLVNLVAIVLGGGLITLAIEWRRHKREMQNWQREDETIQIDVPVSNITRTKWKIDPKTSDKDKLMIYENQLENSIKLIIIYAEFVIRNTTPAEIIITNYGTELLSIPAGSDIITFYDLETFDVVSVDDFGAIRLKPYATIPRALVFVTKFDKDRKLAEDALPTTLVISVTTSSGKVIRRSAELNLVLGWPGVTVHEGVFVPTKFAEKFKDEEDDVPF